MGGGGRVGGWHEGRTIRLVEVRNHFSLKHSNSIMQAKQAYLKLAKVKVFIQCFGLWLRESISVNLLRDALFVTDSTCRECLDSFVIVQISTTNLHEHNRSG